MTYEAWRISFQSGEQATRSAYMEAETLRAKVAEQEAEIEGLVKVVADHINARTELREQLTAAQAQIEQLREALTYAQQATCLAADDAPESPIGKLYSVVSKANEQASPLDALREHDARLVEKIDRYLIDSGDCPHSLSYISDQIRKGEF